MTISADSYGSVTGVADLVPRYATETGTFDTATRPTLSQVETYIDEVSAIVNVILAGEGFTTPVTESTVVMMLDLFVNQEVASIAEGVNGSGRFGPRDKTGTGANRFSLILKDFNTFIKDTAVGIERMGAARSYSLIDGVGYRDKDINGQSVVPMFQREDFDRTFENSDGEG